MAQRRKNKHVHVTSPNPLGFIGGLLRALLLSCLIVATVGIGYYGAKNWKDLKEMPDIASLERYDPIEAIQIYDRYDHLVCTVEGDEDRRVVPLTLIATQMQQAILAAEDHHFYEHHGVNPVSIVRAFLANMAAGKVVEGGSTITQQLVKNLFFAGERTMHRKVKEAFLSWEIERRYTKEKILELYLNQVYFGNGAYGIERAASRYFGKTAASLSLGESAFLSGLVKAPSELSVPANRDQAISRQKEILDKMVEYGYVTSTQAQNARKQELVFKRSVDPLQKYPYYVSYVLQLLRDRFSQAEMRRQGLRIFTNLDPAAQEAAEKVLSEGIKKAPKGVSQGALASVAVSDGSVIALVGGVGSFWKNQWNRATNPHTAGSSFKPFVYLTGLIKNEITPDTVMEDSPITIKQGWGLPDWSPKNFDHKFMGPITIRRALALSRNVISVKIAQKVGIDNVVETARLAGVQSKLDPNLSLALGSSAVTPLEMAGAFTTFARGGVAIRPRMLRRIEDSKGQVIELFEPTVDKVFQLEPVAELVDMLQDAVRSGTGTQARLPDRPVAGKTGTADEAKDIWFIGFTPDLATAVWAGNDENLPIPGTTVTGGTVMAKIWKDYNTAYYQRNPTAAGSFIAPSRMAQPEAKPDGESVENPAAPVDEHQGQEQPSGSYVPPVETDSAPPAPMQPTDEEPVPSESPGESVPLPRGQIPPGPGAEPAPQAPPQPAPQLLRPETAPMPAPSPRVIPH